MVLAILLQVRATLEAKFGSRADSQTGQDLLGTILLYAREYAARFLEWQLLYDLVLWNFGQAVARRHTPDVCLGEVEHQDIAAMLQAWARVGYKVADSQLPVIDTMLGLPARTPEEVAAAQQAKQNAAKAQQPGQGQQQQEQESARV
jgi:phage gp29-like protein